MPTKTFFNLPEEKRRRLIDAAWEEFTSASFARVSINRIILRAGIPRGSFYQYFADKEDLFRYLLGQAAGHFQLRIIQLLQLTGGDMFSLPVKVYDQLCANRGKSDDPMVDRCLRLLRVNPGTNLFQLMPCPPHHVSEKLWEVICTEGFRHTDEKSLLEVLTVVINVSMPFLLEPLTDEMEEKTQRDALCRHLEIVRRGACA